MSRAKNPKYESMSLEELKTNMEKSKKELEHAIHNKNILARMGKNQYVSMETIEKICKKMNCTIDEMMEFTD